MGATRSRNGLLADPCAPRVYFCTDGRASQKLDRSRGVIPRLKSKGHPRFVVRSFTDPLHHMESALAQVCGADGPAPGSTLEELVDHLARLDPSRCLVFFFDQFEEFFSLLAEADRNQFLNAARRLTAADQSPVRMVFALREDVLAEMSQLKTAIPEIFHHEYRLKRLSRQQASRAITEPARAVGAVTTRNWWSSTDDLGDEKASIRRSCKCLR